MAETQSYSIILSDDEIQAILAQQAQAKARGDEEAAWQCEHQLKLSKLYERMRSRAQETRLERLVEADTAPR